MSPALQPTLSVHHLCQFAQRHTVYNGDRKRANTRPMPHVQHRTVYIKAVRIGPVEHQNLGFGLRTDLHQAHHRDIISIEPKPYILYINDQDICLSQQILIGPPIFSVIERMYHHAGFPIDRVAHMFSCVCISTKAVFGREDSDHLYPSFQQHIQHMLISYHTRMIGEKHHSFALQQADIGLYLLIAIDHALLFCLSYNRKTEHP